MTACGAYSPNHLPLPCLLLLFSVGCTFWARQEKTRLLGTFGVGFWCAGMAFSGNHCSFLSFSPCCGDRPRMDWDRPLPLPTLPALPLLLPTTPSLTPYHPPPPTLPFSVAASSPFSTTFSLIPSSFPLPFYYPLLTLQFHFFYLPPSSLPPARQVTGSVMVITSCGFVVIPWHFWWWWQDMRHETGQDMEIL